MLDVKAILRLLANNIESTGLPVPAPHDVIGAWSRSLNLPRRGEILLFTGGLYQLLPYIEAYARQLEKLEDSRTGGFLLKTAGRLGKLARLAGAVVRPDKESIRYSDEILRSIIMLLRLAGVELAYDPELDGYNGVLLHDMGLEEAFHKYLEEIASRLERSGAEIIVTVDPHTTYVLRTLAPKLVGFDLTVKSYLEILDDKLEFLPSKGRGEGKVAVHDPCLYARREGIIDEPRRLLERAGYNVVLPKRHGKLTYCCGGPIESIAPRLSGRIAEKRVDELAGTEPDMIAVMCPICLANLKRASSKIGGPLVEDISVLLARGWKP